MALHTALFLATIGTAALAANPLTQGLNPPPSDDASTKSDSTLSTKSDSTEAPAAPVTETKAQKKLQLREEHIQEGRKDVQKALSDMVAYRAHLAALANDTAQIEKIASEVQDAVKPTLTDEQRNSLEEDYKNRLAAIRGQDGSAPGAETAVADSHSAAEKDLDSLRDADRKDARGLRREFSRFRDEAHGKARDMARASRKALHVMGNPTGLENAMERAGAHENQYDPAEDSLEHQKDRYNDQIDSLQDHLDDQIQDIYSKVHDRIELKADALEEDASTRRDQRRKALMEAAETLKMSGSLRRVEQKLHRLEKAMGNSKDEPLELIGTGGLVRTNTVCTALIAAGLVASLALNAMQRSAATRRVNINQASLLA